MGRRKVNLKRIHDERACKSTFKQRTKGLIKKISKFSIDCGVEACLIVYDGEGSEGPVTWPKDPEMVNSILQKYERLKMIEPPPKTFDVIDFFENKKNMVETEISKVGKEILKMKYPTWDPSFINMSKEQLEAFIAMLNVKIGTCDHKISMLENKQHIEANYNFIQSIANTQNMVQRSVTFSHPSQFNVMKNFPIPQNQKPLSALIDLGKQVDVSRPPESRNQQGKFREPGDLDPLVEQASQLVQDDKWADQLLDWASLPDHLLPFNGVSFRSQNEKQGAIRNGF